LVALVAPLRDSGRCIIAGATQSGEAAIIAPMHIPASNARYFRPAYNATILGVSIIIASGMYIVLRESNAGTSATYDPCDAQHAVAP
jgi:hypothetical protein